MKCKHCKKNRICKSRGLCRSCYSDDKIKVLYPTRYGYTRKQNYDNEPTLEELEELIRERYPTMPVNDELEPEQEQVTIPQATRVRWIRRKQWA